MNSLKSHVIYDSRKRRGILLFTTVLIILIVILIWYHPEQDIVTLEAEQLKVEVFQKEIDSLKSVAVENNKPKIYPFNPNFITDYRGYTLGMSTEEVDRLLRFRESGKWINSSKDFKKVTKVSDSLLAVISPYFKFPEWVTNPKPKVNDRPQWKTKEEKQDLNTLTYEALLRIEGVNEQDATKITQHHKKVKGYQVDQQIYDVYGVTTKVKRLVLDEYTVKEKPIIDLINVNTATASDLSTVPLLNFDLAKEIVDYRILREGIKSLDELQKLEGMTEYKFERIKLYLRIK